MMDLNCDLSRFTAAHKQSFQNALNEIHNGRKETHWMWYIFPQVQGLGRSETSRYYSISGLAEAKEFWDDPYLGGNLKEICSVLLQLGMRNPTEIFGRPDDMKLRSCMTLFSCVAEDNSVFDEVLNQYFDGKPDYRTLKILKCN